MMQEFTKCVIDTIKSIPYGQVMSYGEVADLCGSPKGARQVVRVLHIYGGSMELPWHRVIKKDFKLPQSSFIEEHKMRLIAEGLKIENNRVIKK